MASIVLNFARYWMKIWWCYSSLSQNMPVFIFVLYNCCHVQSFYLFVAIRIWKRALKPFATSCFMVNFLISMSDAFASCFLYHTPEISISINFRISLVVVDLHSDAQYVLCNSLFVLSFLLVTWTIDIFHFFNFWIASNTFKKNKHFAMILYAQLSTPLMFSHHSAVVQSFPFLLTPVSAFYLILKYVLRMNMPLSKHF